MERQEKGDKTNEENEWLLKAVVIYLRSCE